MEPNFDFEAFTKQVANPPSGPPQSETGELWIDGEYDILRKDGIRVVLGPLFRILFAVFLAKKVSEAADVGSVFGAGHGNSDLDALLAQLE